MIMDSDRVKGTATNVGGKVKEALGSALGDRSGQMDGLADQASGRVQAAYGSAKDAARDATAGVREQMDQVVKQQPMLALLMAAGVGFVLARMASR